MEEVIDNIVARLEFHKEQQFREFLGKCLGYSHDSSTSTYAEHPNVIFRMNDFFKGFANFINEYGKDKKLLAGTMALKVITDEIGFDLEESQCFILFHLRELGKFRLREDKLAKDLQGPYANYPEFRLEGHDLTASLKGLMRDKFIDYRRGNLHIRQNVIVRYRTKKTRRS